MGYWDKLRSMFRKEETTTVPEAAPAATAPEEQKQPTGPYRTDAPISDSRLDVFDREPFAHRIADTIGERNDPSSLVVGIYGPWGDGKTTVLNFIQNRLKDYPSIICVPFNPWRMEGEQALLQGFFATLADVLDKELTTDAEKLGDVLKKYGSLLKIAPGGWGDAAVGAGTALSAVSLDELRNRISTMLREADRRVVIIMDDIDRLDRSEIQAIFRLVKLTGDFENTAYVLAFDEQMVASAIGEKYASSSGQSYEAGINFLEKIVQVPLHLPPPSPDALRQYCFELVDEALRESGTVMSQKQVDEFVRHFIDGIQIRLKTPRMAKRYANALHFALTILKGESYTTDLLLVEGLRMFYPKLYDAIRHDPEPVLRTRSADKANADGGKYIQAHTEGLTADEKSAAANLVQALFPRMGSTIIGSDWEAEFARDQRIASSYYFPRYFTYGVSSSDVPDLAEGFPRRAPAGERRSLIEGLLRSYQR
jgi:predicted KAP-like P-loop ATPase